MNLSTDLAILEVMASEMTDYLKSDVLFWPLSPGNMPRLTLGSYLMRQYRLVALPHLLSDDEQARLSTAMTQFNAALDGRIVRFEQRGHKELDVRFRQWQQVLNDFSHREQTVALYAAAVETRAMITALMDKLSFPPFQLNAMLPLRLANLDKVLSGRFQKGDFVWPEAWQLAYPETDYWWLYGQPR